MDDVFLLFSMMFAHIVADFNLQGVLADMKQAGWWDKSVPAKYRSMVKYDWIVALVIHGFAWSFCMCLPYYLVPGITDFSMLNQMIVINAVLHSVIDAIKCYFCKFNLVQDQMFHLIQVIGTWLVFVN